MARAIRAMTIGGGLTAALYASGLLIFLTPLPIGVLVARRHRGTAIGAALIAVAFLAVVSLVLMPWLSHLPSQWNWVLQLFALPGMGIGQVLGEWIGRAFAVGYLAYYLCIGWIVGEGLARAWSGPRIVLVATLTVSAVFAGVVIGVESVFRNAVIGNATMYMDHIVGQLVTMMGESGVTGDQIAVVSANAAAIAREALRVLPAFYWITGLYVATVNVLFGRWIVRAYGIGQGIAPFAAWRLPFPVVWIFIGSGVAFFADRYIVHGNTLATIGLNGLIGCGGLYLLQGLAIVQTIVSRSPLWWRSVVYIMIVLWVQLVGPLLALLGLIDAWVDVRSKLKTRA